MPGNTVLSFLFEIKFKKFFLDPIFIEFYLNIIDREPEEMEIKYSFRGRDIIETKDL